MNGRPPPIIIFWQPGGSSHLVVQLHRCINSRMFTGISPLLEDVVPYSGERDIQAPSGSLQLSGSGQKPYVGTRSQTGEVSCTSTVSAIQQVT